MYKHMLQTHVTNMCRGEQGRESRGWEKGKDMKSSSKTEGVEEGLGKRAH